MQDFLNATGAAKILGVRPRDISDVFYQQLVDDSKCPIVGRARIIPQHFLPTLRKALIQAGKLSESEVIPA